MKKVALVFVIAVVAPSLALAWLALRSLRDQELVAERQQTLLCQGVADNVARAVNDAIAEQQQAFNAQVEQFLTQHKSNGSYRFDPALHKSWPLAEVGFIVSLDGEVLAPSPFDGAEARQFRLENDRFLCNRESAEVFWSTPKGTFPQSKLDGKDGAKAVPEEAQFRRIVGDEREGTLARFLQDRLKLLFWYRSEQNPKLVFGAQVRLVSLVERISSVVNVEPPLRNEIALALLTDTGHPVSVSHPNIRSVRLRNSESLESFHMEGIQPTYASGIRRNPLATHTGEVASAGTGHFYTRPDWRRPFVSAEVGEVLPHWEVAVYLLNPAKAGQAAATARLTVGLLVGLLVLAIGIGSWLIASDMRRQLALARQKTDFVSNVSHELKTPLTSIRMFSEMLAEGRVEDDSKRRHFLGIITAEAARLTRLINNVLDFARLERGEKKYDFAPCDLAGLARETVESYRPHLEAAGFTLKAMLPAVPVPIRGDRDALAQVMVNLLSNAEKYSGDRKEIEVELATAGEASELRVLDRGLGVPRGSEEKIFEQFYRAHDSLGSGIQGSGLGLTLARQIARAHGGDVTYRAREGGGSCFTLRLAVSKT